MIRDRLIIVRSTDVNGKPVSIGRVAENRTVKIITVDEKGNVYQTRQNIGGWNVSLPSAKEKEN